jgi:hypothetical protein
LHLNFRCEVGAVKYRDNLNILWQGTRWCVFRSMAENAEEENDQAMARRGVRGRQD